MSEREGQQQSEIDDRRLSRRMVLRHQDGHLIVAEHAAVSRLQPGVHMSVLSDVSEQVMAEAALREARQRLHNFTLRQQDEFDQLRGDLARDLHDQLGQTLSALKLEIDLIASQVPSVGKQMYRLVREAVASVRDVSRALRPVALDLGLVSALRAMTEELSLRSDVDIKATLPASLPALSEQSELGLFRIAQEALTNATNHAQAASIELSLHFEHNLLLLEIRDNGQGFVTAQSASHGGLGLLGMQERAKQLGAELLLETAPTRGTCIRVTLQNPVIRSSA
jgi:signal transduction histidine kinase